MSESIKTGLGEYSKDKFNALINVRSTALGGIRAELDTLGFTEVSTASLVNIAGSCENPNASFKLNYYGRDAHLSQSAQLQLEALVMRLKRGVYTVNNSFREENYDDPEMTGRRLSEFTLIEPEAPLPGLDPDAALSRVMDTEERVLKAATRKSLELRSDNIALLGGNLDYLASTVKKPYQRVTYDEALKILNEGRQTYSFGHDLGIREERQLLQYFEGTPTFVTHFPASIKFFNMKRTPDGERAYSADLLMPMLGETTGGAVREEDGKIIKKYTYSKTTLEIGGKRVKLSATNS